ncbi:MAG: hypothetical protein GY821_00105 [Gammaproteobacteria bacterium]|nr:hypothetical protein [Gammaproteobacteria bacterium]
MKIIENNIDKTVVIRAKELAYKKLNSGYELEAVHQYNDEHGAPIYWKIRLKNHKTGDKWVRPMCASGGAHVLGDPQFKKDKFPYGKPLYQLDQIIAKSNEIVIVCEGEWCVDHLSKLGLLATTSGSASSADIVNWQPLQGRDVMVWPDNDKHGHNYAKKVQQKLCQLGCNVAIINTNELGLLHKSDDAVDWLQRNADATSDQVKCLPVLAEHQKPEKQSEKQSQSSMIIDFASDQLELFHDQENDACGLNRQTGEVYLLDSEMFQDWLLSKYYRSYNMSISDSSFKSALSSLKGLAKYQGEYHDVFTRCAEKDGRYYLDLAISNTSKAVIIDQSGWQVIDRPPIKFVRQKSMSALPEPLPDGDITLLFELINVPNNTDLLIITYLIDCLRTETPYPLLALIGEQGSAKSTSQNILKSLIDPSSCNLFFLTKKIDDIYLATTENLVLSYENIGKLIASQQNAFCAITTGSAYPQRNLYKRTLGSLKAKRPIMINAITDVVTQQDLIDRTILIELPRIESRTPVQQIERVFQNYHCELLGALLTIMAKALGILPTVILPDGKQPRMIEFALLGVAVERAMNRPDGQFMAQYNRCLNEAICQALDDNPIVRPMIEWFESRCYKSFKGPLHVLMMEIQRERNIPASDWPTHSRTFGNFVRQAQPILRGEGIKCESHGKKGRYIVWGVSRLEAH